MNELLQRRPIMVALAAPNGAGKSSFYSTYLKQSRLPFINADRISLQTGVSAYKAAELADEIGDLGPGGPSFSDGAGAGRRSPRPRRR